MVSTLGRIEYSKGHNWSINSDNSRHQTSKLINIGSFDPVIFPVSITWSYFHNGADSSVFNAHFPGYFCQQLSLRVIMCFAVCYCMRPASKYEVKNKDQ